MLSRLSLIFAPFMMVSSPVLALLAIFLGQNKPFVADPILSENLYIGVIGVLGSVIAALFWQLMKSRDEQVKILKEGYTAISAITKALSDLNTTILSLQESLKIKETLDQIGIDRRRKG